MLNEYENIEKEQLLKAYQFGIADYSFIRYCFAWTLVDTFIIVIANKGYIMYWGFDD